MSHMQLEYEFATFVVVDGPYGGESIPVDVCGNLPDYEETIADCPDGTDPDDYYKEVAFAAVAGYCENVECYEIEEKSGWYGRISAPGYMDASDWSGPYDSEAECKRALCEDYDMCPACGQSTSDDYDRAGNPACRIYHSRA